MAHHKIAYAVIAGSWLLAVAFGSLFAHLQHLSELDGIYWATATVTTVGYGDIVPHSDATKIIAILCMVTAIPLWSGSFGLFFSWLVGQHVRRSEMRIKKHVSTEHEATRSA